MTPEQRLYLDEHPQFWLVDKRKNNVINSDNKQESFEDLTGSPIADTTFPAGLEDPTYPRNCKWLLPVLANPGVPYYHDDSSHTQGLISPNLPPNYDGWERNLSVVLCIWGTAVKCLTYNAARWLIEIEMMLEVIHAHPDTCHSMACTMLHDRAKDDFRLAKTNGTVPNSWESFKCWITRGNSIATSMRSFAKAGNTLHQGPNEALNHFVKQFFNWQTQAKAHSLLYDCNVMLNLGTFTCITTCRIAPLSSYDLILGPDLIATNTFSTNWSTNKWILKTPGRSYCSFVPCNNLSTIHDLAMISDDQRSQYFSADDDPGVDTPNQAKPHVIETDTSDYAVGAVLLQTNDKDDLHPVAYESSKLNSFQCNYPAQERQLLAILHAWQTSVKESDGKANIQMNG
ncbi:hypothetical protein PSTT_04203 [Puccinia striiformis]|uniref:Reverse transcriptase/retrotransposon-derived protein RNase H-like domain-containing protein n=1 Tax=Puccinia striiformis TaxID=27350 RepID=A0A2S4VSY4_9BASI|nr:hypothetical protein PSTT_04203 [Puccinia striiformis]